MLYGKVCCNLTKYLMMKFNAYMYVVKIIKKAIDHRVVVSYIIYRTISGTSGIGHVC